MLSAGNSKRPLSLSLSLSLFSLEWESEAFGKVSQGKAEGAHLGEVMLVVGTGWPGAEKQTLTHCKTVIKYTKIYQKYSRICNKSLA
jgi:hypothetical protein